VFEDLITLAVPTIGSWMSAPGRPKLLVAPPARLYSGGEDCQDGPAGSGSYYLPDDGTDVETPQGWDQGLEDLRTDNAAYSSGHRVSGA
jgi:hypothetical protein